MSRFRRELNAEDMERMRVPRRYWTVRFDEIVDDGDEKTSLKRIVGNYMGRLDEMFGNGIGLLLWGANGRGKSAAAVVVAKEFRRCGYSVLFIEAAELKRSVIEKVVFDDNQSLWERVLSVDVLIVDDLGKGTQDSTGYGARLLDEMFRHRSANQLVTWITTNMNPREQLAEELKTSTLHSLKECVLPVQVVGPDRRDETKSKLSDLLTA